MVEQLWGAGTGLVLVLGYVLLVQAMTAAIVLLAEFIVMQWRTLRSLLMAVDGAAEPEPAPQVADQAPTYRLGGDLRW